MGQNQDSYGGYQRARFMRPDAARYMRPDAGRFIRPDAARFLKPGSDPADVFPGLDWKYSPSQRRIPAGKPGGGRWTNEQGSGGGGGGISTGAFVSYDGDAADIGEADFGGDLSGDAISSETSILAYSGEPSDSMDWGIRDGLGSVEEQDAEQAQIFRVADGSKPPLDEFGEPYYKPGGHHEMPKSIYEKWDLPPETRRVFEDSTTGPLPKGRVIASPDGELRGHFWDGPHRDYRDSVSEISSRFLRENDIMETSRMTPDQARDLLGEIRKSEDPAVRDYNRAMRFISRNFRIGSGRGSQ